MKKVLFVTAAFFAFTISYAEGWLTDFSQAKEEAAMEHKDILMLFQGSDWCSVCMRLDKEILGTQEFMDKASEDYVLLKVDFPRRKANALQKEQQEQNNHLAELYNQNGYFPLVVILDEKGHILGKTGYKKMSTGDYMNHLASIKSN